MSGSGTYTGVSQYPMPNGTVLQARWYEATDDITLRILPGGAA